MNLRCKLFTMSGAQKFEAAEPIGLVVDHLEEAFAQLSPFHAKGFPYCDIYVSLNDDWHYIGWFYLNPSLYNG